MRTQIHNRSFYKCGTKYKNMGVPRLVKGSEDYMDVAADRTCKASEHVATVYYS